MKKGSRLDGCLLVTDLSTVNALTYARDSIKGNIIKHRYYFSVILKSAQSLIINLVFNHYLMFLAFTNLNFFLAIQKMAIRNPEYVSGFICQRRFMDDPAFLYWTPGNELLLLGHSEMLKRYIILV